MRRVSADEDPPVAKAVRHKAAADPIFFGDQFVTKVLTHTEDGTDRPIPVDRIELGLLVRKIVVHQPPLAAVDREYGPAAPRIA